jgi:LuxR family maltose regulon positive regulatory protein
MLAFARTKIQPPRARPGALLPRPALQARLVQALQSQSLVLLAAAAGYGKTSALTQAIEQLPAGTALAWVGCDEGDTPLQLFACLVAALEPYDLPWRTAPESLVATALAQGPGERDALKRMVTELINALDACDVPHGVIAVDDLHRVASSAVHRFLDLLMQRFTPRWTLAITTRQAPPLALARLRARGEVAEFDAADLRFDAAQARALCGRLGLDAPAADALFARTEGWPAGLQLALSVLRSAPSATLAGSAALIDRRMFDFLADEVLARLPDEMREFLLVTSVLPELTAARCAALTGDARAAERLDEIERAGLFVTTLPAAEPTLRLHDLLRDALEQRLARERPQDWPELLRRAALGEPDGLRRVGGLQRAQAWHDAEQALCAVGEELATQGAAAAVGGLLERFAPAQRDASPGLQLLRAQLAWSRWDWPQMLAASGAARAASEQRGDAPGAARAASYEALALGGIGRIDEARALATRLLDVPTPADDVAARALLALSWIELSHGDQRRIAALWQRLLGHLQRLPQLARWYECTPLPPFVGLPGMRAPLLAYLRAAERRWPDQPSPPRGMCAALDGLLRLWVGDVEQAQALATQAEEEMRWLARPVNLESHTSLLQALLHAVRGEGAQAQALVQRLIDAVQASGDPVRTRIYLGVYLYGAMRCAATVGDEALLEQRATQLIGHLEQHEGWVTPQHAASAHAYRHAVRGDLARACAAWRELLAHEHQSDMYGQVAETRLRLADALLRLGRPAREAGAALAPLFETVAASGEWGAALLAGPAVLERLARALAHDGLPAAQAQQLGRWAASARALAGTPAAGTPAAPRPPAAPTAPAGAALLSAREREVLARIAAGDSNKLIARAFELSPHTVKRHVANILDKLNLRSRGQAAAWYHDHVG